MTTINTGLSHSTGYGMRCESRRGKVPQPLISRLRVQCKVGKKRKATATAVDNVNRHSRLRERANSEADVARVPAAVGRECEHFEHIDREHQVPTVMADRLICPPDVAQLEESVCATKRSFHNIVGGIVHKRLRLLRIFFTFPVHLTFLSTFPSLCLLKVDSLAFNIHYVLFRLKLLSRKLQRM